MVNVLIIGATGYIGSALSPSLLRSGCHYVYGLARSQDKAKALAAAEVVPILGSLTDMSAILAAIERYHINIVVDLSGDPKETPVLLNALSSRADKQPPNGCPVPKLGYIYCSGTWVHGSSEAAVNDLFPVGTKDAPTPPPQLVAWRTTLEQEILAKSNVLDVMIVRPALVYGRSCAIWTSLFNPIYESSQDPKSSARISIAAEPKSRPGLIHVDDVASGFHAAIDRLPLISGTGVYPVFDLVTSQESMKDILEGVGHELGVEAGRVHLNGAGDDLFAKALSTTANLDSGRARTILGWEPKRFGFLKDIGIYVQSWKAARS